LLLLRGGESGRRIDRDFGLRGSTAKPLISIVTHGEIAILVARNGWGEKRREALERMLGELVTIDINHPDVIDAYVAIDLQSQRHPDGARNMGKNDLWIGACARAAGATLLTTDKDFGHLHTPMLSVEVLVQ